MSLFSRIQSYQNLVDVIEDCKFSDNFIVWHGTESMEDSYRTIQAEAYAMAKSLPQGKYQRIGLIAEMDRVFIIRFFACQYAGITPVVLPIKKFNDKHWHRKITHLLQSVQCDALWTHELNQYEGIDCFDERTASPCMAREKYHSIVNDEAYIQFSSGTTGQPKGIVITQQSVLLNIWNILKDGLCMTEADKALSWLPLFHDMGLVGFFLASFTAQCELHYLPTPQFLRNPMLWLELISKHKITISYAPNSAYQRLSSTRLDKIPKDLNLSSWRIAGIGAEKIHQETLQGFQQVFAEFGFNQQSFWPSYGMAEATLAVSMRSPNDALINDQGDVSCGRVLPTFKVAIHSKSSENRIGEIAIQSDCIARCYGDGSQLPMQDGYFLTGDLGYVKDDQLYVVGRAKECMIINGQNIWPQDVEKILQDIIPKSVGLLVTHVNIHNQERIAIVLAKAHWDKFERESLKSLCLQNLFEFYGLFAECFFINNKFLLKTSSGKPARLNIAKSIENFTLPLQVD